MQRQRRDTSAVRLTHVPTGESVTVRRDALSRPWGAWVGRCLAIARPWLTAKVFRPAETPIRRTYDLCPPPGIEPNVREGDRWLVTGRDAVREALDGGMPWLPEMPARPASGEGE